jgi:transcription initiation factor TFIID subunit 7
MEEQFILRVPENLKKEMEMDIAEKGHPGITIDVGTEDKITFVYKDKSYAGSIVRLPCIIESHKTMDNKQFYKTSDISSMIVVGDSTNLHLSGITPPMKYVKVRRFRKRSVKSYLVEEIEKRVKELIEKDMNALNVVVEYSNKKIEESDEDVSSLAAEIEYNLMESAPREKEDSEQGMSAEIRERKDILEELEGKIRGREEQLRSASNIIVRKRFQESLDAMRKEYEKIKSEISELQRAEGK